VVSVDTKKKELVGRFANGGAQWQPSGEPVEVNVHDFPDPALGKAIPYGVYDLGRNAGWASVGVDHDTAAFAVATPRRWWEQVGRVAYPKAARLLVMADAGGSNGYRVRAWKTELAHFAAETGLAVTVCHFSDDLADLGSPPAPPRAAARTSSASSSTTIRVPSWRSPPSCWSCPPSSGCSGEHR
jgi:hypothetical protein